MYIYLATAVDEEVQLIVGRKHACMAKPTNWFVYYIANDPSVVM